MKSLRSLLPLILPATLVAAGSTAFGESPRDDWPQWRGEKRDGVWRETGLLEKFPAQFEAKWSVPIGSGYCGPTVADGRVYVMDRVRMPEQAERVHCFE